MVRIFKPEVFIFLVAVMCPVFHAEVCCFPKQLEGNFSIKSIQPIASVNGIYQEVTIAMSFDWTQQRIREYFPSTGFLQLMFFKEGVVYQIANSTCVKGKLSRLPSSTVCVPDGAKLLKKYQLGIREKLNVTDYMFNTSSLTTVDTTVRTVTDMCVPVEDKVFRKISDRSVAMYTWTYESLTPGIKDPRVFDVPGFCKSSPEMIYERITNRG